MSVYVDAPIWHYGRMIMCHMLADSTDELLAMVDAIGVDRKWIQKAGTAEEHFDIAKSKRAIAIKLGAIEIDRYRFVEIVKSKRQLAQFAATQAASINSHSHSITRSDR